MGEGRPVETPWETVDKVRGVVEERHAAHARLGLPRVDITLAALDRLDQLFSEHAGPSDGWCRRCREDTPCAEVRAGEILLGVIARTETEGLEKRCRLDA